MQGDNAIRSKVLHLYNPTQHLKVLSYQMLNTFEATDKSSKNNEQNLYRNIEPTHQNIRRYGVSKDRKKTVSGKTSIEKVVRHL